MMTMPVMPCSVAVFTIGLMLAFTHRINIFLVLFLCHWALIGLAKVYFFGIPEDFLLAASTVPALYLFSANTSPRTANCAPSPTRGCSTGC